MFGALILALTIRYRTTSIENHLQSHWLPFSILFCIWIIVLFINNAYDLRKSKNNILFFQNLLLSFLANFFLGLAFFYFIPAFRITPKTNLILVTLLAIFLVFSWRALFNWLLGHSLLRRSILFLGYHPRVEELILSFANDPQIGFHTTAIVDPNHEAIPHAIQQSVECFADPMRIRSVVDIKDIHTVVIAPHLSREGELEKELYELLFWRVEMTDLASFYEYTTGRINTDILSESWFWQNLRESRKQYYDTLRSALDILAAILIGIIFLLFLPFIAFIIALESGRPIFIKQKRVGLNNKTFTIYKLRTMYAHGKDGMAESNGPQFTQANDNRVTKIGKWLRKFRIDELPQAWNILRRDMNFIGPRPERPEFVEQLQERMPFYSIRHLVRPGLTGWAQVNYRYGSTIEENLIKLEYDLFYMKNRSLLLDAVTVLKTVNILLRAVGQ